MRACLRSAGVALIARPLARSHVGFVGRLVEHWATRRRASAHAAPQWRLAPLVFRVALERSSVALMRLLLDHFPARFRHAWHCHAIVAISVLLSFFLFDRSLGRRSKLVLGRALLRRECAVSGALHCAQSDAMVRLLVARGARCDERDASGGTPLHAALERQPRSLALLVGAPSALTSAAMCADMCTRQR